MWDLKYFPEFQRSTLCLTEKKGGSKLPETPRGSFFSFYRKAEKTKALFFQDVDMYPCFSPQWRDLQKIRYLHGQLKLRLTGADDPFQIHFPASGSLTVVLR